MHKIGKLFVNIVSRFRIADRRSRTMASGTGTINNAEPQQSVAKPTISREEVEISGNYNE